MSKILPFPYEYVTETVEDCTYKVFRNRIPIGFVQLASGGLYRAKTQMCDRWSKAKFFSKSTAIEGLEEIIKREIRDKAKQNNK